jgi:hypothetical protein
MSEVRLTEPVRHTYIKTDDRDDLVEKPESLVPKGSWTFDGTYFTYVCPCGCKSIGVLRAALNEKPSDGPSWLFDGNYENPTLTPSINHMGHWHGWLRNGWWEQA